MKKMLVLILLNSSLAYLPAAFGQNKPRLGILPFSGGSGDDGERIALFISSNIDVRDAFTVVPPNAEAKALMTELYFQSVSYTDSDTAASLGRLINADFIISGHILHLNERNLIITTIIRVATFEQLAGDFREIRTVNDFQPLLPDISSKMIAASRRDTAKLPALAIVPFNIANDTVNVPEAEIIFQILAVEIANTGKYAVLPRITTIFETLDELEYLSPGLPAEKEAEALGRSVNAGYILDVAVSGTEFGNKFAARIVRAEDGSITAENSQEYRNIDEGMRLMAELALSLAGRAKPDINAEITVPESNPARLWSIGILVGTSFSRPWYITTVNGTLAPLRYSFFEIGFDLGLVSGDKNVNYYSLYSFAHYSLFLPFSGHNGWYAGAGGGYMWAEYFFPAGDTSESFWALDAVSGFIIGDIFNISFVARTNFKSVNSKLSIGFMKRF